MAEAFIVDTLVQGRERAEHDLRSAFTGVGYRPVGGITKLDVLEIINVKKALLSTEHALCWP